MSRYTAPAETPEQTETQYFKLGTYADGNTLLGFEVTAYDPSYKNPRFTDPARPTIWANVIVVDGPDRGREWASQEIVAQYVVPRLEPKVGSSVLGRVHRGTKSNAIFLEDPTVDEIEAADALDVELGRDEPPF